MGTDYFYYLNPDFLIVLVKEYLQFAPQKVIYRLASSVSFYSSVYFSWMMSYRMLARNKSLALRFLLDLQFCSFIHWRFCASYSYVYRSTSSVAAWPQGWPPSPRIGQMQSHTGAAGSRSAGLNGGTVPASLRQLPGRWRRRGTEYSTALPRSRLRLQWCTYLNGTGDWLPVSYLYISYFMSNLLTYVIRIYSDLSQSTHLW